MKTVVELNTVYYALPPDFMQKRNDKTLLLWSYMPFWMVVNEQLLKVLTCFNGKRTLGEIIDETVGMSNIPAMKYELLVKKRVAELLKAKVLSDKPEKLNLEPEDTEIKSLDELFLAISNDNVPDFILNAEETRIIAKNIFKNIKAGGLFILTGSQPVQDQQKLIVLIKAAIFRGLNVILELPSESYNVDLIKELSKLRVIVQINFDAASEDLNDAIQGAGSFQRNVETINNLVVNKIGVIVNMWCSEHNQQEIEGILKLAKQLNVTECRIKPLRKIGKYKDFRVPDYREILNGIITAVKKDPDLIRLLARDLLSFYVQILSSNARITSCRVGSKSMYIDADGLIYPCIAFVQPEYALGNVLNDDLKELLEESSVLKNVRCSCTVDAFHNCSKCVIRYWCRGGCRGETIQLAGDPLACAPACRSLQMAFIDMFWQFDEISEGIKPKQPYC